MAQLPTVNVGDELGEVVTEQIGFGPLGHGNEGVAKLKLLPTPWPNDALPPASATLLSVASRRGLLAAASPNTLVISSTENVRNAFKTKIKAGEPDVINDFKPDSTLEVPQLRHVAFSADEEYLVLNPEGQGILVVYNVDDLLKGSTKPAEQITIHNDSVRALLPNPDPGFAHYMVVIGDSGRLDIVDITKSNKVTVDTEGKKVTCGAWSVRGRAYVVGFEDGTAAAYKTTETLLGKIPRPPDVDESYSVTSISYLSNDDFFLIHSPPATAGDDEDNGEDNDEDTLYHFAYSKFLKNEMPHFKDFTFHKAPYPLLWPAMDAPERTHPPRYSVTRLRNWEPSVNDMVILAGAYSSDITMIINTSEKIASTQETTKVYQLAGLDDHRKAQVPQQCLTGDSDIIADSVLIGEALDLSSKEKVERPSKRLEEIDESPTPLPAYFLLTHEGLLVAYWVVWDQSLQKGSGYSGLTALNGTAQNATPASKTAPPPSPATKQPFTRPCRSRQSSSTTNSPVGSKPGSISISGTTGSPGGSRLASTPTFGTTSNPFGSKSGSTPTSGSTSNPFGFKSASTPTSGTTSNPFGAKPASTPAFGVPSSPFGSKPASTSPFGAPAATPKFGAPSMGKPGQATFGATGFGGQQSPWGAISQPPSKIPVNTFSSNAAAPSGFASFATKTPSSSSPFGSFAAPSGDKPGFVGLEKQTSAFSANGSTALSTGPSFTSNASTVDFSSFGSGTGSNTSDAMTRERDEATPTPQLPAAQKTGFSGLPSSGFALGSIFKGDGTAKDDKTTAGSGGSLFGNGFNSVLTETTKPPATPEQAKNLPNFSNTPATQPKQPNLFSGSTPAKNKPEVIPEEAPLPPDPMTYKPAKIDDDLPPIAGSPPVQVEAPSSSIPSSPLEGDDEEGAVSDEEQEDTEGDSEDDASEDDAVEPSPSNAARRGRSSNRSPPIYPAAPTPPPQSSQQFKPMPMPHGQPFKASPLSFGQSVASANQSQTSLGGTRREPLPGSGQSLSASVQHSSRPPTPQPQVRDLVDDEDERIRQELASDREPTRVLDDFLARQEYNGAALSKTGHAAQIEIVYRDINNMVDTLGLNWRSLKSFIDYHEQPEGYTKLTQETLTQIQQLGENGLWYEHRSLAEIEDLKALENDLEQGLEEVRVQNLDDKRTQLSRLFREQGRLSTKLNEIRSTIIHRKDPEKLEAARKASLPKELADQQKALRNEYGRLLTLLGEAEGAVMLLKSKLASYNAENGKTGAVPTVDAIKKTINKLIMITEKKSNEIALLESQFRKVGLADSSRSNSSTSRQPGTPLRRSRAFRSETPAVTPPTNRSKMSLSELNRRALTPDVESTPNNGFGRYYTPEGTPSADKTLTKLGDLGDVDLARLRGKATRRRMIVGELEAAFGAVGAKQRGVFN